MVIVIGFSSKRTCMYNHMSVYYCTFIVTVSNCNQFVTMSDWAYVIYLTCCVRFILCTTRILLFALHESPYVLVSKDVDVWYLIIRYLNTIIFFQKQKMLLTRKALTKFWVDSLRIYKKLQCIYKIFKTCLNICF